MSSLIGVNLFRPMKQRANARFCNRIIVALVVSAVAVLHMALKLKCFATCRDAWCNLDLKQECMNIAFWGAPILCHHSRLLKQ